METKILEILNSLHPEFDFSATSDFIANGMLDSFDIVALVDQLEDAFDVEIDGEDIVPENFSSIKALVGLINKSSK